MAVIYLQHPHHGTKVATMDAEAIYDEEYGWVRYNPAAPAPAPGDEPVNGLAVRRRRPRVNKEDDSDGNGG
jgi:hypothetical protein